MQSLLILHKTYISHMTYNSTNSHQ